MKRIVAVGLSWTVVLGLAASGQATSVAFSFGDGTQGPLSGSVGPGVAQPAATWNLVNASGWPNNGNQFNTFSGDFTTDIGALVSDSSSLGTAMQLTIHDAGQYAAWRWWGEWGGGVGTAANIAPAGTYDEQHVAWAPAQHEANTTDFTFSNIPYASYDVYIGGQNLWYGSTAVVVGGTKLEGLTESSFTVSNPLRGAYDPGAQAWLSYVQIVEAILKDGFGLDNLPFGNHESWTLGDANDDGEIGPEDFGLLKDNFGLDGGPTGTYPLANVPEPTSLVALFGLVVPMLLKRRSKA
ncbi:MAG: hypothetical protein NTV86_12015 [Planctomycetota bacterium]|nr:hypothetical protein [Planctomycetota bacterium]